MVDGQDASCAALGDILEVLVGVLEALDCVVKALGGVLEVLEGVLEAKHSTKIDQERAKSRVPGKSPNGLKPLGDILEVLEVFGPY